MRCVLVLVSGIWVVFFIRLVLGRSLHSRPRYMSTNDCLFAATLPAHVRQSAEGAEAVAFVPQYEQHLQPDTVPESEHAPNNKRLLWGAYTRILAPLMDTEEERDETQQPQFVDGFRYYLLLHLCPDRPRFLGVRDVCFSNDKIAVNAQVYACFFVFLGGAYSPAIRTSFALPLA